MARRNNFRRRLGGWFTAPKVVALLLGLIGVLIGFGGYLYRYCTCEGWPVLVAGWEQLFLDFYTNISASLVNITITVLTIDWLNERQIERQLKLQLIREMRSTDNGIALLAVSELWDRGWVHDGSLQKASLPKANLQEAILSGADLRGANLREACLDGAYLTDCTVTREQLAQAKSYEGAKLPFDIRPPVSNVAVTPPKDQATELREAAMRDGTKHK